MADKAQVVAADQQGQFKIDLPRSAIDRIDVVDVDFVLQTKSGQRLIIPGAAMEAMSSKAPPIHFADGPISSADLLAAVEKVETPATSIPVMASLTEYEMKKSEGNKKTMRDGPEGQQQEAQNAQNKQVAPLQTEGQGSTVDKLVDKADDIDAAIRKGAFDPAPIKPYEPPSSNPDAPGSAPPTAKIPLLMSLNEGNTVDFDDSGVTGRGGKVILGGGGPTGSGVDSGILPGDALQYATEVLTGTAGGDDIYADGFNGLGARANT
ncbi:MAG TPA: hypothetical protein VLL76_06865, partial [Candidatus Omnitrophota bacterium]|nr:hypothetical protein [Candidatus Omnitrophota bacterium]